MVFSLGPIGLDVPVMAALRSLSDERKGGGAYTIIGKGINTSALNFGAALSKAQTIATRVQREIRKQDKAVQSIYIRRLGEDRLLARIDVHPDVISTYSVTGRS
jgi:hypothetical protein